MRHWRKIGALPIACPYLGSTPVEGRIVRYGPALIIRQLWGRSGLFQDIRRHCGLGFLLLFALFGLPPFAVLIGFTIKLGLAGQLSSAAKLLLFGGLGLVAAGGCAIALFFLTAAVYTGGSQELGFVMVAICFGGGGAWVGTGLLALVGALGFRLADTYD